MITLQVDPHPLLELEWFTSGLPAPLQELKAPWLAELLKLDAPAPFRSDDAVRGAVRDLLRQGGYKPTGRGKPASEYLVRAATEGALGSINVVVDACNAASLHSGIPISVVDLDLAKAPFRAGLGRPGEQYVFNASGQVIDVEGLLCLFDADGPCANAVKDAQRTKTHGATRRILALMWGTRALPGRAKQTSDWYQELLRKAVG